MALEMSELDSVDAVRASSADRQVYRLIHKRIRVGFRRSPAHLDLLALRKSFGAPVRFGTIPARNLETTRLPLLTAPIPSISNSR